MRSKVICLRPKHDLDRANIEIPKSFDIRFFPQYDEETVLEAVKDADFILASSHYPRITAKLISQARSLKLIQLCGAGYETVDLEAADRAGIPVARCAGQNSQAVAQLAFTLMTILNRGILEADNKIKKGRYQEIRDKLRKEGTFELEGLHLGILGIGPIGKEMARIGAFFRAKLLYYDIVRLSPEMEKEMQVTFVEFTDLLRASDILTLHLPLNASTQKIIGRRELALMKNSAILINTSRGGLLDDEALVDALKSNSLKGAALDAFDPEPLPPEHPFLTLDAESQNKLLLTSHLGGTTRQAQNRMYQEAIDNILAAMRGETPRHVVNMTQLRGS